jgi:hypothetical protein
MATALVNDTAADAAIVAMYPEIVGIEATMDALAAAGRKVFTQYLEDCDHGPAIEDKINLDLTGLGYRVKRSKETVTVSFP